MQNPFIDAASQQAVDKFSGINNVDAATRLSPAVVNQAYVYPLQEATNVLIDNTFQISSRLGYESVLAGTDIHSLWSDGKACFFCDDGTLKEMDTIYGLKTLKAGLMAGARISYAPCNDRYYFTNKYDIGYIKDNASYELSDPSREFKMPLPAGQLIEYFLGVLYVARDNILYIADPLCDYYDTRTGYRIFNKDITMLRAVDGGLYVSDDRVWFVKGRANEDFERDEVYSSPAIIHTDVSVSGKFIDDTMVGKVAIWTGENGICLGDANGTVLNLTDFRFTFAARGQGTGFIREVDNIRHYINTLY